MPFVTFSKMLSLGLVFLLLHRPIAALDDPKKLVDPKLGTELTDLYTNYIQNSANSGRPSSPNEVDQYVFVDVSFTRAIDNDLAKELLSPAVQVDFIECVATMCSVRIPVSSLKDIAKLESVLLLQSVQAKTNIGSVTSEGDVAMFSNLARTRYSVNGSGLLIGVMSDSYNCRGGAASDLLSGDLPNGANRILILNDLSTAECTSLSGADEGRAMMQLIYDVAPGARLAFRTAYRGQASFAAGIIELAAAGCDIIVDDIIYLAEPMFQDGIIAQAVDQVVSQGIPFFSASGNNARNSWEAPTGFNPVTINNRTFHRFGTDSNGSPIIFMRIVMQGGNSLRTLVIQWDEAFASVSGPPGSRSDIDFVLRFGSSSIFRNANNIGFDPVELFQFAPSSFSSNATVTAELSIESYSGPLPTYMKFVVFGQVTSIEFATRSSTSYGHSNAAQAAGVGAASYASTPAFGVSPPLIESFSSPGGTAILLTKAGIRLPTPEIRNQPRFTGPDGGVTTFFGSLSGGLYRFFGTSAAAPHVAAVAALMLQYKGGSRSLTPAQIYSTLATTAIDMNDPSTVGFDVGFDFGTGSGLVNASAALNALSQNVPVPLPVPVPAPAPIARVPAPAPFAPVPAPAPIAPVPAPAPLAPVPAPAPIAPVPAPVPFAPVTVPVPFARVPAPAPIAAVPAPAPIAAVPAPAPIAQVPAPAPIAPVPAPVPVASVPVPAPIAPVPAPAPIAQVPAPAPIAPVPAPAPIAPVPAPVLVASVPVPAPIAPVPAPAPIAPVPAPAPIAPVPAPAPIAPVPAPAPIAPVPAPAPIAPVLAPAPNALVPAPFPNASAPAPAPIAPVPAPAPIAPVLAPAPNALVPAPFPNASAPAPALSVPVPAPVLNLPVPVPARVVPVPAPKAPVPRTAFCRFFGRFFRICRR